MGYPKWRIFFHDRSEMRAFEWETKGGSPPAHPSIAGTPQKPATQDASHKDETGNKPDQDKNRRPEDGKSR
jgi:hypothetical protein